jgi:hypothetical protein
MVEPKLAMSEAQFELPVLLGVKKCKVVTFWLFVGVN